MGANLLDVQTEGRKFVDRYELVGEIASGGMASVYLARLTGVGGFQRLYAIKRLHPHLQMEKEFVQMFLDEARLAAGIHHPNVVPILEVGASQNSHYLVMEYVEGDTLAHLLASAASKKQRIPIPQVIRMALDTLSGLHAAHELRDEAGCLAGVVHRDVSPQNILVGVDGISRITDFGVARATSRLTATRVGQLKGKIAYMAPEQARGEEMLDRRADVFAAGVVFWEALAHRRLFKAPNEAGTLSRVLLEPIPHLNQAAPQISGAVCDVIMSALERNPAHRISSCAEFADALERASYAGGELGSSRHVQAYMNQVLGPDILVNREALRAWTALADAQEPPPQLASTGTATNTGLETLGREFRSPHRSNRLRIFAAFVLLFALGGAGVIATQKGSLTKTKAFLSRITSTEDSVGGAVPSETPPSEMPLIEKLVEAEVASAPQDTAGKAEAVQRQGEAEEEPQEPKLDAPTLKQEVERPVAAPTKSPKRSVRPARRTKRRPKVSASEKSTLDALDSNPYR